MHRRSILRRAAVAGSGIGTLSLSGCLERLGFEEESAWSNPPLVEDRPDAVYLPASTEKMARLGTATGDEFAIALGYTIPHRFWLLAGESNQVDVQPSDSLHLMVTVWDRETELVVPATVRLELVQEGEGATSVGSLWPMISQQMGFHYGDNVELSGDGTYTARVQVGPLDADRTGAFGDRLDGTETLTVEFTHAREDVHDLGVEYIDTQRRGTREALDLRTNDSMPSSRGQPLAELPGDHLGTADSGDARVGTLVLDAERVGGSSERAYLAVTLRTPYNDVMLPFAGLSATVDSGGDGGGSERTGGDGDGGGTEPRESLTLTEAVDPTLGHHYGAESDVLSTGQSTADERETTITISVETPPQVARHDGYETAFRAFDDVRFQVQR